jgi:hypothetical protein
MIESGEKPEEYRLVNEYWVKRLTKGCTDKTALNELQKRIRKGDWYNYRIGEVDFNKGYYSEVEFTLGYPKKGDMSRRMVKQIESITIGFGNPEWGAPMFPVFIIRYK